MRTCSMDNCDRKHEAHGLCKTHYNQTAPSRYKRVLASCECCEKDYFREKRKARYKHNFCSIECANRYLYGERCEIPEDHWARMWGKTCKWKAPEVNSRTFVSYYCAECASSFIHDSIYSPSTYCSAACAKRVQKRARRALEHGARGTFRYCEIMRQYQRQGRQCAYCKLPCAGLPDPEHVLPLSRGGRNDMNNLVAACRQCNTDKGDLTLGEWATDRARRGLRELDYMLTSTAFDHLVPAMPTKPAWRHQLVA